MATDPAFAAAVQLGSALLGTAETNLQVPTQSTVVVTAGVNGTKIEEIVAQATQTTLTPTTVAGLVYLFLYDGATYNLFDTMAVTAVVASTTTAPYRLSKLYTNLVLKSGWSLRASHSIVGNANILKVTALGGDF